MSVDDFPSLADAPEDLRYLDGGCGPVTAWQVLTNFGMDVTSDQLLAACRFDPEVGVYPIGLAVALAHFGLRVSFFSDPDPNPQSIERELYQVAKMLGVTFENATSLLDLDALMCNGGVSVLFYEADRAETLGHFTPVLGVYNDEVVAPNEGDGLSVAILEHRRQAPGILRQYIVAWQASH